MRTTTALYTQSPILLLAILSLGAVDEGCNRNNQDMISDRDIFRKGWLTARRNNSSEPTSQFKTGVQPLQLDGKRDGFIYVPKHYSKDKPAPLALMLHGAGGQAQHGLDLIRQYADERNIILLAPASREMTWDIIVKDSFDADVIFINQALDLVFKKYNIDTNHIAIGGFSDGASYALSLGLSNGDLFTHIIAFSPGFSYTVAKKGKSSVFISHGIKDRVLPINPCSRRIVPQLQGMGYQVNYKEFEGEHEIPPIISAGAIDWFLGNKVSLPG
jgi:predicted esterase